MKKIFYLIFAATLFNCGDPEAKKEEGRNSAEENTVAEVSAKFRNVDAALAGQLNEIIQHYIHLKNGLVQSNTSEAKAGAEGMLKAIEAVDTSKMSPEQLSSYNSEITKLKESTQAISGQVDLEKQREAFNPVTESVHSLLKNFGGSKPFYYQFCSMANNNNGGYWISESEEVKNPYFGDDMLNCGEVKETLK